jgi:hypothetical protein
MTHLVLDPSAPAQRLEDGLRTTFYCQHPTPAVKRGQRKDSSRARGRRRRKILRRLAARRKPVWPTLTCLRFLLKLAFELPFRGSVETGAVSSTGPLAQQIQLEAARTRMMRKQQDQQGQAALELIQSATPTAPGSNVGSMLNIVA